MYVLFSHAPKQSRKKPFRCPAHVEKKLAVNTVNISSFVFVSINKANVWEMFLCCLAIDDHARRLPWQLLVELSLCDVT